MFLERPPVLFRHTVPGAMFRVPEEGKKVYLTFDDGPIPEVTPWVLDLLDRYHIKATFFMVGDNARKYPELYREVRRRGHNVGNHTMHHVQGLKMSTADYLKDVEEASHYIKSDLFRPPHGWLKPAQTAALRENYHIVMFDLVTRDYSKRLTAEQVVENVKRYVRPGSVIVFHDSLKSWPRLEKALPASLEWLIAEGYEFGILWEKRTHGYWWSEREASSEVSW